jgi:hypothetical protein
VSKTFGEWYQKTNKTEDTNKLTLLTFKIIAILHNALFASCIKLLETVSQGLFRNRSQNLCHTFLDCRHVCKTCAFHDALQAGKQKEVHRTPLIWRPRTRYYKTLGPTFKMNSYFLPHVSALMKRHYQATKNTQRTKIKQNQIKLYFSTVADI